MPFGMNPRFVNVIGLGFGFMFTFTAFQTMGIIEQTILDSVKEEDSSFTGDGFTSLAIVYAVFSLSNWFVPSVIAVIGPNVSMVIGGVFYAHFIVSFLWPSNAWLYIASVLVGLGAAVIWTGQGNYLTIMSEPENMSRNSGIFWAQLQCSLLFGNLFVYFMFRDDTTIPKDTRTVVLIVLAVVCGVGVLILALLNCAPKYGFDESGHRRETPASNEVPVTPMGALKGAFDLFLTPQMLLLSVTFFYTGIELSFFSGVYSTCVGNTLRLPNSKGLVGMSGMITGVGEIIGGGTFGIAGKATTRHGRDPVVMLGFLCHVLAFFLVFLNLPNDAVFGNTDAAAFIDSNEYLALFCSFMLGFGDACFNTQVYSIIGDLYRNQSSAGFALFKFMQSLSAAICFFYSNHIPLYYQLLILVIFAVLGTVAFWRVELGLRRSAASVEITPRNDTSCAAPVENGDAEKKASE
ncbi:UNC93-like protein MFSD11 [Amphibalanus amphitrite]|uniref:UNC93-like protein MFSD11 n=1 Tax=Amphibalanus amphitrite TaxID=1232801 RepID=UPI001C91C083|nr:UNC93-like protein MFSD11 [Amphibalanus amphitrite]